MRLDVAQFAELMSECMDSKKEELKLLSRPEYTDEGYKAGEGLMGLSIQWSRLPFLIESKDANATRLCLVHLANFCMIVESKIREGKW